MVLDYGSAGARKFITNVGLITSNGPFGHNIMAAEWTHHISYQPGLVSIHIHAEDATASNIRKSKEFGVNLAAIDQNIVSSVSGGSSGKEIDKVAVLKELGVEFCKAKKINCLMVKGAALNAECKLVKQINLGDHIMFVGRVVEATATEEQALSYHEGKYFRVGEQIMKPSEEERERIKKIIEEHRKK